MNITTKRAAQQAIGGDRTSDFMATGGAAFLR
jgi:hypothetical protein